ncbi:HTH-type transcriptional activator CmpR [bacterium HR10]|uniref:LysR family transcriptional regulator n=1 Tax=uncultured Acidobacteriota bacterium TaxID=171953 RepID=H5SBS7_9BACT|nr:LysR family transcriptional regulator [uncultured Acidobacteriota bacterium]GBC82791.1 HTH-type transcriptional activator CmpR [bacterium HR10]
MEFAQLEALVAIARARSFSRAAEQLARTQPALSIAIRKLEEEIGALVFDRSQKEVTLTEVGQILFEYAQKILNLRREALGTIEELRQLHTGRVTIGANESTSLYLLPRIILAFREQHPTIKIEVYRSFSERLPREIKERNLDFGIVSFDPNDSELASFPILEDELVLILPPGHPLAARRQITLKDLGGEPFIAHNVRSPARERVIQAFRRARVPLNIAIELTSIETIKEFVKMGLGLAFVPRMCIEEELAQGKLATVPIQGFRHRRVLRVIYLRDKVHSHAAQKFLEVIKAMAPNARGRRARLTSDSPRPIV